MDNVTDVHNVANVTNGANVQGADAVGQTQATNMANDRNVPDVASDSDTTHKASAKPCGRNARCVRPRFFFYSVCVPHGRAR